MKCPVRLYRRARQHATTPWIIFSLFTCSSHQQQSISKPQLPMYVSSVYCCCVKFPFCFWHVDVLLPKNYLTFIRCAGGKIGYSLIGGFPGEYLVANTIKWLPSQFLLCLADMFFDRSGPDITESSHVSTAQPQKAPADHSSRQGGVGHRGRSYQRAAECEGQKSWCIQAHHTVTRHSSAQGPSEQAAFTLNRLLMNSPTQDLSSKKYTRRKTFMS